MVAAVVTGVFLQVMVTEVPQLVAVFQTAALTGGEWGELLILAAAPMAAHELLIFLNKLHKSKDYQDDSAVF